MYGIIEAPTRGWTDSLVLAAFGSAVVLLGLFTAWELRAPNPMLQLRFFRNLRFSVASLAIALAFFALFGTLFFLTQYLQLVLGYSAFQAGARTLLGGHLIGAARQAFVDAMDLTLVIAAGVAVLGAALALLLLPARPTLEQAPAPVAKRRPPT